MFALARILVLLFLAVFLFSCGPSLPQGPYRGPDELPSHADAIWILPGPETVTGADSEPRLCFDQTFNDKRSCFDLYRWNSDDEAVWRTQFPFGTWFWLPSDGNKLIWFLSEAHPVKVYYPD